MASGSPRARIDQFFASKKRKSLSPGLKSGRGAKEAKTAVEGSPSAKGTLGNYLVTSEDDKCSLKGSHAACDSVKRILKLENVSSQDENERACMSNYQRGDQCQNFESFQMGQRETFQDSVEEGQVIVEVLSKGCSINVQRSENAGLKQFATDFLSLYCSDLQSSLASPLKPQPKVPKRDVNPDFLIEDCETSNKRNHVKVGSDPIELQGSLRKCNQTPKTNACAHETPRSMRGSSIFSPGEAFWNEAVQVADGLFAPNLSVLAAQGNNGDRNYCEMKNLYIPKVGNNKPNDNDNEVSPLPVKHFDFLLEEKNTDESTQHRGNEQSDCGSVSYKGRQTAKVGALSQYNVNAPESRTLVSNNVCDEASTPSNFASLKDPLDLSNWLPSEICHIYKNKGISELYPWQVDCLRTDGVMQNRNLVYCASTSAGKSFVAEILMLRRVISTGKVALLVLPYVSICAEKAEHLEVLLEPLGWHVRSYYGNQGGGTLPKDTSIVVCTIEKANSLINRMLEEGRLSEVGIIVIDELHMVGDQSRGYLLELMLTKLRYAAGEGNSDSHSGESPGASSGIKTDAAGLQIVGMSATMPNVAAVADWLQAALYQTDFRPIPLEEYIKVGNTIYDKKMEVVRTISRAADIGGKDPDHIVQLCNEIVQEGHSVLLFCSSRKGCESTARHVSRYLQKYSVNVGINDLNGLVDVTSAIEALRKCPAGLDPILGETLPCGVAYHHAGLTVEEREIIETCYRKGFLRVLTATSTLAAGVNLPARRVIFRQPRIGRDFIDGTRYRQMAGRAGRTGIDTKGESVLICKHEEIKRVMGLLNESCPPLQSCLSEDKNGMTHAILEVVAGGIVQTANDIHRYVRCTLLNSTKPFQDVVRSAQDSLRWLCHRKFLEWSEETKLYSTTPLGRAAFGSSLCPEESLIVLDDLSRAREGFVLASDLHLVYLVTPVNVDVEPDWELYYERFMELSILDQSVGKRIGVEEPFLMRMAHGGPMRFNKSRENTKGLNGKFSHRSGIKKSQMLSDEETIRVCKRFYVALILSRLVQEAPVKEVCEAFKVARGMVQALQENAGRFASMVSLFCERLGWHDLEGLVSKFQNRVSFGVRAEIVELTTIPYVKGSRARALYKAGLRTPLAIAEAAIPEIVKALFETSFWTAQESSAQRRVQLGVAKKIKNGARKIIFDKAEEARVAAFSAFKSLGVNVAQFSQPLVAILNNHHDTIEEAKVDCSDKPDVQGLEESAKNVLEKGKLMKITDLAIGTSVIEGCSTPGYGNTIIDGTRNADMPLSNQARNSTYNTHFDYKEGACGKGPTNASTFSGGFDTFLDIWDNSKEFYFDIHFNKRTEVNSIVHFEIHGLAICWENSPVYYINLPKDLLRSNKSEYVNMSMSLDPERRWKIANDRWNRITNIMGKRDVRKFTWNLKIQIQVFKNPAVSIQRFGEQSFCVKSMGVDLIESSYFIFPPINIQDAMDMCIVAWILWPDEERSSTPNLEKEAKKRLSSEALEAANRSGRWRNQMRRAAHNGCCRRAAQVRALSSVLWKLLISEELMEVLLNVEMPLVNVLADMEIWGIGVDMEGCFKARNMLGKKLRSLEQEAYKLVGMTFSLYTAADIANVLYKHLKLPVPEGHNKGKQHPCTDKQCLDLLRHQHPVVTVIKEHRTLAKLFNCTLGSICSLARLSFRNQRYTLHGHWLQTSTATGRLSVEEPNLQCVEHAVEFKNNNTDKDGSVYGAEICIINARDLFVPTEENWVLLTADYSQIELRLMAHFSKDSSLIEILSKPHGDVFTMIASRWTEKEESAISSHERDQIKKLVYGIVYGMGPNSLAEQLECTLKEASEKMECFKNSFPGVASWLHEAVASCRHKGYVETLRGRKRFLLKIQDGNSKEKSKAQRQAVNSICQGSAADLIKIAMVNVHSVIAKGVESPIPSPECTTRFQMLKGRCRILLQVHDELVLEADPSIMKEAGLLLKTSMECAASLLVPLQVKLKAGKTWGSLEPFQTI